VLVQFLELHPGLLEDLVGRTNIRAVTAKEKASTGSILIASFLCSIVTFQKIQQYGKILLDHVVMIEFSSSPRSF
jgi:hypothetical protein